MNLRKRLEGLPLLDEDRYLPQKRFLGLLGTGDGGCVASRGNMALRGRYLWDLKDWIDRKWMHVYTAGLPDLEEMMAAKQLALTGGRPPPLPLVREVEVRRVMRWKWKKGALSVTVADTVLAMFLQTIPQTNSQKRIYLSTSILFTFKIFLFSFFPTLFCRLPGRQGRKLWRRCRLPPCAAAGAGRKWGRRRCQEPCKRSGPWSCAARK